MKFAQKARTSRNQHYQIIIGMSALQTALIVLLCASSGLTHIYSFLLWHHYHPEEKDGIKKYENMTLAELKQKLLDWETERMDELKKSIKSREQFKKKIDNMALKALRGLVNDYKEYSAIGSNKNMTLKEYYKALHDFDKKHPRRIWYFTSLRRRMERKLAREAYKLKF
ncbi:unnamed protein product [Cylicocyclus nassatus]|uniref:SXP/RAL-2 family protein Ani s 5-like cation-binding domain-containing protein n=1 Tax=Cylicocyclus nassatus TaxID=53992 RepID=A0AA36M6S1_CYLNA|nr:unnamed protein product [Cylicocyclus nassatus]